VGLRHLISEGKFKEAIAVIKEANPFPLVCVASASTLAKENADGTRWTIAGGYLRAKEVCGRLRH